jgi:glycosyltransferase involved in cell wall biosynthesis
MPIEVAIVVITYQRPRHLRLVLESIAAQQGVANRLELCVTDDGSTDDTPQVVEEFRRQAAFPVRFVSHRHETFQAARCRNDGAKATTAPYLLFVDGDCMLPADHVAIHLRNRKRRVALIGDAARVDQAASEALTPEEIHNGGLHRLLCDEECRRLNKSYRKYRFYNFLRHPTKPYKLRSGNFSIWRDDFESVNGFDENFEGWGGEDDDLGRRLRRAGVRLRSIVNQTHAYHLWHPRESTAPEKVKLAANTQYLWRRDAPTRCVNGLTKPMTPAATLDKHVACLRPSAGR